MAVNNPVYIAAVLLLLVFFSEWLVQKKFFHYLGSSLIVILLAAVLANLHIIPSSQNAPPLYNGIFTYIAPLAIFYLLLDVKLKDIRLAGLPMLSMFFLGVASTVAGTLLSYYLIAPQNHHIDQAFAVAGMYTGTYIGGSVNLNAVALQYGVVKNGTLFAAINAADNIITTIWMIATLILPNILQRFFPRKSAVKEASANELLVLPIDSMKEKITVQGFSLLLTLGMAALYISQLINSYLPQLPSILVLTTIALLLAQVKALHRINGGNIIGFLLVLLFLAVIGAYCDIDALLKDKEIAITLMEWVTIIVFTHGILLFGIGGLLKQDWSVISISSNANIGGATTAGVLATSLNRPELRLPGILVGSVGTAIGTYIGVIVAEFFR